MIHVRLTTEDLREHDACDGGIERFEEVLPDGIDSEWTPLHGWMALVTFGSDYRWAAARGLVPDLVSADFADADLTDADLAFANLARANLARVYLAGANLAGANLADADLADAYVGRSRPVWLPEQWDVRDGYVCRREL